MNNLRKKGTKYTELERKSYLREYLASTETKRQFYKRTGIAPLLIAQWLVRYNLQDKTVMSVQPSSQEQDSSIRDLQQTVEELLKENRRLQNELHKQELLCDANKKMIDLAESVYHIRIRKNSDAK